MNRCQDGVCEAILDVSAYGRPLCHMSLLRAADLEITCASSIIIMVVLVSESSSASLSKYGSDYNQMRTQVEESSSSRSQEMGASLDDSSVRL